MTEIRVFRSKTRCRIRERAKTKPYRRNYEQVLFLYRGTEAIRQGPWQCVGTTLRSRYKSFCRPTWIDARSFKHGARGARGNMKWCGAIPLDFCDVYFQLHFSRHAYLTTLPPSQKITAAVYRIQLRSPHRILSNVFNVTLLVVGSRPKREEMNKNYTKYSSGRADTSQTTCKISSLIGQDRGSLEEV
jgi:hypothetical protein